MSMKMPRCIQIPVLGMTLESGQSDAQPTMMTGFVAETKLLQPGFYWTKSWNPASPALSISEWNGDVWFHHGVSGSSQAGEIRIMSERVVEPCVVQADQNGPNAHDDSGHQEQLTLGTMIAALERMPSGAQCDLHHHTATVVTIRISPSNAVVPARSLPSWLMPRRPSRLTTTATKVAPTRWVRTRRSGLRNTETPETGWYR